MRADDAPVPRQPIQGDVVKNAVSGNRLERAIFGICPLSELVKDPGKKPATGESTSE